MRSKADEMGSLIEGTAQKRKSTENKVDVLHVRLTDLHAAHQNLPFLPNRTRPLKQYQYQTWPSSVKGGRHMSPQKFAQNCGCWPPEADTMNTFRWNLSCKPSTSLSLPPLFHFLHSFPYLSPLPSSDIGYMILQQLCRWKFSREKTL